MKTHLRKYAVIGALICALPLAALSQYDQSMQPADPGDSVASPQDQAQDQAEAQQVAPPEQAPVSTQVFYDQLSPYGQWVNMPNYGYVWIPSAGPGFVPYSTYGHWVYTEYGWTWVSDYAWGWAPFHYGRWQNDPEYGWFWIPDVNWGPAWVCWRHCDGYYGWAPLGWGMNISMGYYGDYGIPAAWWVFCGEGYITDRYVYRHYLPRRQSEYFYAHSNVVAFTHYDANHRIAYAAGPRREDIAAITHAPVRVVSVRPAAAPGQRYDNSHLHLYKPEVTPAERTTPRPAPARAVQQNEVPRRSDYSQPQRSAPMERSAPMQRSAPAAPMNRGGNMGGGGGRGHR